MISFPLKGLYELKVIKFILCKQHDDSNSVFVYKAEPHILKEKNLFQHFIKGSRKKTIESLNVRGVSRSVDKVLRLFFPNLFVCFQEAPKHILFSLLTPCVKCFPSHLSLKISPHYCQKLSNCYFVFLWSK